MNSKGKVHLESPVTELLLLYLFDISQSVSSLNIYTRTYKALHNADITTVEELCMHTNKELKKLPKLGRKCLDLILDALHYFDYELKPESFEAKKEVTTKVCDRACDQSINNTDIRTMRDIISKMHDEVQTIWLAIKQYESSIPARVRQGVDNAIDKELQRIGTGLKVEYTYKLLRKVQPEELEDY